MMKKGKVRHQATQFISLILIGHPKYRFSISHDKTLTNFDHDHQIQNVTDPNQSSINIRLYSAMTC
jgi:hypothetical protein